MGNLLKSKTAAWIILAIMIAVLIISATMRPAWWELMDEFFAFMMAFCHLAAVYLNDKMRAASVRLDIIALCCGILAIAAFIAEWIIMSFA